MSFRGWLTTITLVLLAVVVYFAWPEILRAWDLTSRLNWWILALIIPVQLFSYYATGGMIFSYLKAKGNIKEVGQWKVARMALELNFVNHVFPSGGVAGFSYLGWRLKRYGVTVGRSTIAQIIRFILTFVSFAGLLIVALIDLTLDDAVSRFELLLSFLLVLVCIGVVSLAIFVLSNRRRQLRFTTWLVSLTNKFVAWITRGRKPEAVKQEPLDHFFDDLHQDYQDISRDRKVLITPFIWSIFANIADVMLFWIAFWALGTPVDPASLFVAFGLSSLASAISVTPGGAGVYELVMIAVLSSGGVRPEEAIAGTLLTRVILVLGTILFGYVFYQATLNKYGKPEIQG